MEPTTRRWWFAGLGALLVFVAVLALGLGGPLILLSVRGPEPAAAPEPARTANWTELVPPGWDPRQHLDPTGAAAVAEGSAQERTLMRELRAAWDQAPTRPELDGTRIRLPGYVVPLEILEGGRLRQFLLVPYFGACIHTPPPPANQIVLVTLEPPAHWRSMQAVWVSGTLSSARQGSPLGTSGYAMRAERVERYRAEP